MLKLKNLIVLAAIITPGIAGAQQYILDTGTPPSPVGGVILSKSEWFAAEFSATAGEAISQVSAYLDQATGNGSTFTFELYNGNGTGASSFLGARSSNLSALLMDPAATGTAGSTASWDSATVNWSIPTTGNYWLAIEQTLYTTGNNLPTFDVPLESSTTTGSVPAAAFALYTGSSFAASTSVPFGVQVSIVPEPAIYGFIAGVGLFAISIGSTLRRKPARVG